MKNFILVMLACSLLLTLSVASRADEQGSSALSIMKKLEPEPAKKKPAPEIPTYSNKYELLQDIKDGKGLFFSVRGLSRTSEWQYPSDDGAKIKAKNIAFAKSIKTIIEAQSGAPVTLSLDGYLRQSDCGFAENIAYVTQSLREYTEAVKLKKPPFQQSKEAANELNNDLKKTGHLFEIYLNKFKECVTAAGGNFDPFDSIVGEIAQAISDRADIIKAKNREQFGHQFSEDFLSSQITDSKGEAVGQEQTTVEGFLVNLLTKTKFIKWTVQGNSYKLEATYDNKRLLIEMIHSAQNDSTTLEGILLKNKIQANEILNLSKIVYVN